MNDLIIQAEETSLWAESHIGRSWPPASPIEDNCPCPKAPCGLVIAGSAICDQHHYRNGRTMRQIHYPDNCPTLKESNYE